MSAKRSTSERKTAYVRAPTRIAGNRPPFTKARTRRSLTPRTCATSGIESKSMASVTIPLSVYISVAMP